MTLAEEEQTELLAIRDAIDSLNIRIDNLIKILKAKFKEINNSYPSDLDYI